MRRVPSSVKAALHSSNDKLIIVSAAAGVPPSDDSLSRAAQQPAYNINFLMNFR
jgi:hypothetical protein